MKKLAWILLIIGGLNWGLVGVLGIDLVAYLPEIVARIVYILVGLSALLLIFKGGCGCKTCESSSNSAPSMEGGSNM